MSFLKRFFWRGVLVMEILFFCVWKCERFKRVIGSCLIDFNGTNDVKFNADGFALQF